MKNFKNKPRVQRTHVKQPGPGPKVPEYGPFETIEEAEAAGKAAREIAASMGLKCTVTTIEVHDSAQKTKGEQT